MYNFITRTCHLRTCVKQLLATIEKLQGNTFGELKISYIYNHNYTVPGWSDSLSDVLVIIELKISFHIAIMNQ